MRQLDLKSKKSLNSNNSIIIEEKSHGWSLLIIEFILHFLHKSAARNRTVGHVQIVDTKIISHSYDFS